MDTIISIGIKFSLALALFVFAIKALESFIKPTMLSSRFLGKAISAVIGIIAARIYLHLIERYFSFSDVFRYLFFFAFIIGNLVIAFKIFSQKNNERSIRDARPDTTATPRPEQRSVQEHRRQGKENFQNPRISAARRTWIAI